MKPKETWANSILMAIVPTMMITVMLPFIIFIIGIWFPLARSEHVLSKLLGLSLLTFFICARYIRYYENRQEEYDTITTLTAKALDGLKYAGIAVVVVMYLLSLIVAAKGMIEDIQYAGIPKGQQDTSFPLNSGFRIFLALLIYAPVILFVFDKWDASERRGWFKKGGTEKEPKQ